MSLNILIFAVILIICIFSHKLASRFGMPALVLFMAVGMIAGTGGFFGYNFNNYKMAEQICSLALVIIMFYGGFGTNWKSARPVAVPSFILASVGVILTAALTGLFCVFVLKMKLLEGLLVGSVIGSTDAASVFSILRSRKLNLRDNLASLLELESGSNDPTAYTLTAAVLTLMNAESAGSANLWHFASFLFSQIVFGIVIGFAAAWLSKLTLEKVEFDGSGLATLFVLGAALASYAVPLFINGNGYLSVYITGIILGNSHMKHKVSLVHFFDSITWLMQILLFFVLGLLAFPSEIPAILLPAVLIGLFLTFIARPLATMPILTLFKIPLKNQLLVAWAGLRGSSSIVFAIIATVSTANMNLDVFHIVFTVAVLSVTIQGGLFPFFARRLQLVDDTQSVYKTFNDYIDPEALRLVDVPIMEDHEWARQLVKDINIPKKSLVVLIKRGEQVIVPKGNSEILPGDVLVVNYSTYYDTSTVKLKEEYIGKKHVWNGKCLRDIVFPPETLVIMIKRGDQSITPAGNTKILTHDTLVLTDTTPV